MERYFDLESVKGKERGCVAAVGNFDGVHLGHQEIFRQAVSSARGKGSRSLVLTFSNHPVAKLRPQKVPGPITTLDDRLALIATLGIDAALILSFDQAIASLSPFEFVDGVLVNSLAVSEIVVGEGWRFGREREGDSAALKLLAGENGFSARTIPAVALDGMPVSSTRIREALGNGDVDLVRRLLDRPHFVRGGVVAGAGRGRTLGFPTVNLSREEVSLPSEGVYAGGFFSGGFCGPAAVNIGSRPTFGSGPSIIEAHLPGVDDDFYGRKVILVFLERLRGEVVFPNEAAAKQQIARDVEKTVRIFSAAGRVTLPL